MDSPRRELSISGLKSRFGQGWLGGVWWSQNFARKNFFHIGLGGSWVSDPHNKVFGDWSRWVMGPQDPEKKNRGINV